MRSLQRLLFSALASIVLTQCATRTDLQTDPAEETNIVEQHPEITNRLSRELRTWQRSVLNSLREKDYPKK